MIQIHTIRFGSAKWMKACVPTQDAWLRRLKLPLRIWTDKDADPSYPHMKFCALDMLREFLASPFERMMYLDADTLIHPHAPLPPDLPGMVIRPEKRADDNPLWQEWCMRHYGRIAPESARYHNAGVWLCDKPAAEMMLSVAQPPFIEGVMEQHQWNWWLWHARERGMQLTELPAVWNRYPKEWHRSWLFHAYGERKEQWIGEIVRRKLLHPLRAPRVST